MINENEFKHKTMYFHKQIRNENFFFQNKKINYLEIVL